MNTAHSQNRRPAWSAVLFSKLFSTTYAPGLFMRLTRQWV
jgi:hypothetical protein